MAKTKKITELSSPNKKNSGISLLCIENGTAKAVTYPTLFETKTVLGSLDDIKTSGLYHITQDNSDLPDPNVWYLEVIGRSGGLMQRAITSNGNMLTRVYQWSNSKWTSWHMVSSVSTSGGYNAHVICKLRRERRVA